MKGFIEKIIENRTQIIEIILLILCCFLPFIVDAVGLFSEYLTNTTPDPQNAPVYLIVKTGKAAMSVALFLFVLRKVRTYNKDFLMNRGNTYHQYPYVWYWFCANILGIRKCNLVRVPIFMQFILVIRGTFANYPLEEMAYPIIENESNPSIDVIHTTADGQEINLILEDTYVIDSQQIPKLKQGLKTIKISRNDGIHKGRHFSQKFIDAVIDTVRNLEQNTIVNIYATTNPMNTKHIASRAFALADRGNIQHLYVFQQQSSGNRSFENKGYKIF